MPKLQNIWMQAIRANQEMIRKPAKRAVLFEQLLRTHRRDGMLHYERGEAHEYLGDRKAALSDFERAYDHFPLDDWKEVANTAINRVSDRPAHAILGHRDRHILEVFHSLHCLPELDVATVQDSQFAVVSFSAAPRAATVILRCCFERSLKRLLSHRSEIDDKELEHIKLDECIERVEAYGLRARVHQSMRELKRLGNKAVHESKEAATDFSDVPQLFLTCVQWVAEDLRNLSDRFFLR